MTTAIILCGGLGTRLKKLFPDVPKAIVTINERPFLFYLLDYLKSQKIDDVILSIGYKSHDILRTIPKNYQNLRISFCQEDDLLGTGGAIIKAVKDFKIDDYFFILNGDTYFPIDLNEMKTYHKEKNADLTIAITSVKDTYRYGRIEFNSDGKMKNITVKRDGIGHINGGIYFCHGKNFYPLETKNCNLEIDIILPLLENKKLIYCYKSSASFVDIGTEEGWLESIEIIPKEK